MITTQSTAERITLLRSLRGCPCTVIFALAIFGRKMTNKDLQLATGYSDKPITDALQLLTLHGMVVDTGKSGWTLSDGMKQLPLFPEALLDQGNGGPRIITAEGGRSEYFRSSPLSSSSLNTTHSLENKKEEEKKPANDRKNSDHVENPGDNSQKQEIIAWLLRANIGRRSPKLRQILAANPDPAYIQAHVLYYEWWQAQRQRDKTAKTIDGRTRFTTGTLITRILDNDPAPPLRCPDCGRVQTNCLCEIIER